MAKQDDLSEDHLEWLVESRSKNQALCLSLFKLLKAHPERIRADFELGNIAQGLVAVAFSLWRAVFLSDSHGTEVTLIDDAENFLGKLILDNAIAYPQDRMAREWTFNYYINNARYRLLDISEYWPYILSRGAIEVDERLPKAGWTHFHNMLALALEGFANALKN